MSDQELGMSLTLKPGSRLYGAACTTELIVVKTTAGVIDLRIGGHPALRSAADRIGGMVVTTAPESATLVGKRYVDADESLEVLCTRAGAGAVAVGDVLCEVKEAKALPASD